MSMIFTVIPSCSPAPEAGVERNRATASQTEKSQTSDQNNSQDSTSDSTSNSDTNSDQQNTSNFGKQYTSQVVTYGTNGEKDMTGFYLANKNDLGTGPAIIAIHGNPGINSPFKEELKKFVNKGYKVFAPDLYYGSLPKNEAQAESLQQEMIKWGANDVLFNLYNAAEFLAKQSYINSITVVGWDQGGYWATDLAIKYPSYFQAAINFYGAPYHLSDLASQIQIPMLHIYPEQGLDYSKEEILSIEQDIKAKASVASTFKIITGAQGKFLDPSLSQTLKDYENIDLAYQKVFQFLDSLK